MKLILFILIYLMVASPLYSMDISPRKKPSRECDEVIAFADMMFGEGENQTFYSKLDLARFLYSESLKNDTSVCMELHSIKHGGAPKYSSMNKSLNLRKNKNRKEYDEVLEFSRQSVELIHTTYSYMSEYDHYITIEMAKNNPPIWFKEYIIVYKISGDHVFVKLDFNKKNLEQYNNLIKEIELYY